MSEGGGVLPVQQDGCFGRERTEGVIVLGSAGRCPKAGRLRFRIGAHVLGMDPISQRANPTLS
jgi:hypothetical protein